MKKIQIIHNKTKDFSENESPYNPENIIIQESDLVQIFENQNINISIQNINLYRNAFVHKSYCTMKNDDFETGNNNCPDNCLPLQEMSYERLEFLGDSILGMVVANYLHERYKEQNEGFLSKMRTKIVNGKMLGYLSEQIGFNKFAIISKQVESMNGRKNYKIMEDIFEAFIGAMFIDNQSKNCSEQFVSNKGFYFVERWIINILEKYIDFSELIMRKTNYKDMLSAHMQSYFQDTPKFFERNIETKNNIKIFTYVVKNRQGLVIGTSTGASKKEAENNASYEALKYYGVKINN